MANLLEVENLHVSFHTYAGEVQAVRGVSFTIKEGEAVAIVGESGCGKSVTAKAIMRLLPPAITEIKDGNITFDSSDLLALSEKKMQFFRGKEMSMIFQDPMTSLNPTMRIGDQIAEGLIKHNKASSKKADDQAVELLRMVGIPEPERRLKQYPHEFSGGMRQRAMIAIALACQPKLLLADEPTTALDVTIQAQILELLKELQQKLGTSLVLITHDLGVVAETCERVVVMYAGQVVETGKVKDIFNNPLHPYTQGLLKTIPRIDRDRKQTLEPIPGTPPDLLDPPKGCAFFARCPYAMKICQSETPELLEIENKQLARCWLHHPIAKRMYQES
ncbi:ABC transporter ATP-binding protein [Bacillus haimaensis]|uniref:ABC transporter ATP-binding protein n=1 Tax=Bacillus haimaensis TaxID=3160967 RepID=UPI003AA82312